jgi:hypothetical protein
MCLAIVDKFSVVSRIETRADGSLRNVQQVHRDVKPLSMPLEIGMMGYKTKILHKTATKHMIKGDGVPFNEKRVLGGYALNSWSNGSEKLDFE